MVLKSLSVNHFRNLSNWRGEFGHTTLIHGLNGVGKTSIIEALSLLSSANSFRAGRIDETIQLGEELSRIQGEVIETDEEEVSLELLVTRGLVQGKKTQSRLYSVNGVRRRKQDFVGKLATVVFRPEDMRLIEGSPGRRRAFLDSALSTIDWQYERALTSYEKTLKNRNRLLQQISDRKQPQSSLTFWNLSLVQHGEYVQRKRQELLNFLQTIGFQFALQVKYIPSVISEARLAEYLEKEMIVGHSLIGPHKDDFCVQFPGSRLQAGLEDWLDIASYGSRGQQRLAVLWLKLGELEFMRHRLATLPILLLDDILSELDEESRDIVLGLLATYQTIVTTADQSTFDELHVQLPDATVVELATHEVV